MTGRVLLDVRDLDAHAARRRCAVLPTVRTGARIVLLVGSLAPPYEVTSLLAEHAERLNIEVWGEPYAVPGWLEALRDPGLVVLR